MGGSGPQFEDRDGCRTASAAMALDYDTVRPLPSPPPPTDSPGMIMPAR